MRRSVLLFLLVLTLIPSAAARDEILVDTGWKFFAGEPAGDPSALVFDMSSWQDVTLPHDWTVGSGAAVSFSGNPGQAWYRRELKVPYTEHGKHVELCFDGISRSADVYLNGRLLGHISDGWSTNTIDITPYLNYGGENALCVHVDASGKGSTGYAGAGICQDVRMLVTDPVHVPQCGTRIIPEWGKVGVSVDIVNRDYNRETDRILDVYFRIEDAQGFFVAISDRQVISLPPFSSRTVNTEMNLDVPHMWDLDDPYMYRLHTYVCDGNEVLDESVTPFGIRDIEFDPQRGFLLNNRKVQLFGTNLLQDAAAVGSGISKELWKYRLGKLRGIGVVAIRCIDAPASPALLEACDETGMLAIQLTGTVGVNEELRTMSEIISRDMNHPSVMLWNLGEEDPDLNTEALCYEILRMMTLEASSLDPSRRTTYSGGNNRLSLGIAGVNGYGPDKSSIAIDHSEHRFWRSVSLNDDTGSGTRGTVMADSDRGWKGHDRTAVERNWDFHMKNGYVAGPFFSLGFDGRYRSSEGCEYSQTGLFDYCAFPKDEAFYLEVQATKHTVLHLCPVVNNEVWIYSSCDEVNLYADGKNLGRRKVDERTHLAWKIPAGTKKLTAKGYKGGTLVSTAIYPEYYPTDQMAMSRSGLVADGKDILVMDFSTSKSSVPVSVSGPVEILGWGNGSPAFRCDTNASGDNSVELIPFNGRVQLVLRSLEGKTGQILVNLPGMKKPLVLEAYGKEQPVSSK